MTALGLGLGIGFGSLGSIPTPLMFSDVRAYVEFLDQPWFSGISIDTAPTPDVYNSVPIIGSLGGAVVNTGSGRPAVATTEHGSQTPRIADFNGTSQHLYRSGGGLLAPASRGTMICTCRPSGVSNKIVCGSYDATPSRCYLWSLSGSWRYALGATTHLPGFNVVANEFVSLAMSWNGTTVTMRYDECKETAAQSGVPSTAELFIGSNNGNGTPNYRWDDSVALFVLTGEELSDAEWAAYLEWVDGYKLYRLRGGLSAIDTASSSNLIMDGTDVIVALDHNRYRYDEAVNGAFSVDSGWSKGTGWTISGGLAHANGVLAAAYLEQDVLTASERGLLTVTTSGISGGSTTPYGGTVAGTSISTNATHRQIIAPDAVALRFSGSAGGFTGELDDVSWVAGNHSEQIATSGARPTWNAAEESIGYDGTQYLSLQDIPLTEFTLCGWVYQDPTAAQYATLFSAPEDASNAAYAWVSDKDLGTWRFGWGTTASSSYVDSPTDLTPGQWNFLAIKASTTNLYFLANTDASASGVRTGSPPGGNGLLGRRVYTGLYPFVGKHGKLELYGRVVPDAELMARKWLLMPAGAFNSSSRVIVHDGNSLSMTNKEWMFNMSLASEYVLYNIAVGGQTTQQMLDDFDDQVPDYYPAGVARRIYIAWEIVNHIDKGATSGQALTALYTLADTAQALGYQVVIGNCMACGTFNPTKEAYRAAVNADIALNWSSHADALVDLTAPAALQNPLDGTYFLPDTVHLTAAGYAVVGGLFKAAIEGLP